METDAVQEVDEASVIICHFGSDLDKVVKDIVGNRYEPESKIMYIPHTP